MRLQLAAMYVATLRKYEFILMMKRTVRSQKGTEEDRSNDTHDTYMMNDE